LFGGVVRLKSARLAIAHCELGHHREFNEWHDYDHRPEIHANTPLCYYSLRWVAPPDYVAARPATSLSYEGGEYFYIYLSEGSQEQWSADVAALSRRLSFSGREAPLQYLKSVFGGSVHLAGAATRPGYPLSADAVPLTPANTALVVSITEVTSPERRAQYAAWHDAVRVPAVLAPELFNAYFHFMPVVQPEVDQITRLNQRTLRGFDAEAREKFHIYVYFLDSAYPLASFERYKMVVQQLEHEYPTQIEGTQHLFTGIYRPIVPGQYDSYT
jgi:hypothetical protein